MGSSTYPPVSASGQCAMLLFQTPQCRERARKMCSTMFRNIKKRIFSPCAKGCQCVLRKGCLAIYSRGPALTAKPVSKVSLPLASMLQRHLASLLARRPQVRDPKRIRMQSGSGAESRRGISVSRFWPSTTTTICRVQSWLGNRRGRCVLSRSPSADGAAHIRSPK